MSNQPSIPKNTRVSKVLASLRKAIEGLDAVNDIKIMKAGSNAEELAFPLGYGSAMADVLELFNSIEEVKS